MDGYTKPEVSHVDRGGLLARAQTIPGWALACALAGKLKLFKIVAGDFPVCAVRRCLMASCVY